LVVIGIGVSFWTRFFEFGGIIDGPVGALAGFRLVVSITAAVLVRFEFGTGGRAGHCVARGVLVSEFVRTSGVDVGGAAGLCAVVLVAASLGEGAWEGGHGDGEVEAVHKANIIKVLTTITVESDLSQRDWFFAPCPLALDFIPAVTSFAVTFGVTPCSPPKSPTPPNWDHKVPSRALIQPEASSLRHKCDPLIILSPNPNSEGTVISDFDLVAIGQCNQEYQA